MKLNITKTALLQGKAYFSGNKRKLAAAIGFFLMSITMSESYAEGISGENFAFQKQCFACHAKDTQLIGPPYQAIAARYPNADQITVNALTQKVLYGGGGKWGIVPMVPNHTLVNEQEAMALVKWILSVKK